MRWKQRPFVQCSRSGRVVSGLILALRRSRLRWECRISSVVQREMLLKFIELLIRHRATLREVRRQRSRYRDQRLVHCHHLGQLPELLVLLTILHTEVFKLEKHQYVMSRIPRVSHPLFGRDLSHVYHRCSRL